MSTLDSQHQQEATGLLVSFGKWRWSLTYDRKHSERHKGIQCRPLSFKHDTAINFLGLSGAEIDYLKEICIRLDPLMFPIGGMLRRPYPYRRTHRQLPVPWILEGCFF